MKAVIEEHIARMTSILASINGAVNALTMYVSDFEPDAEFDKHMETLEILMESPVLKGRYRKTMQQLDGMGGEIARLYYRAKAVRKIEKGEKLTPTELSEACGKDVNWVYRRLENPLGTDLIANPKARDIYFGVVGKQV